jgi:hypothetical protein
VKTICLGDHEVEVAKILTDQHLQVLKLELQIAGLQDYLETRHEIISWLKSIQANS